VGKVRTSSRLLWSYGSPGFPRFIFFRGVLFLRALFGGYLFAFFPSSSTFFRSVPQSAAPQPSCLSSSFFVESYKLRGYRFVLRVPYRLNVSNFCKVLTRFVKLSANAAVIPTLSSFTYDASFPPFPPPYRLLVLIIPFQVLVRSNPWPVQDPFPQSSV